MPNLAHNSDLQLGTWLQTGSPIVAELADLSGFDWLLIDLEHGCGTEAAVLSQIQVIRRAAAIVRVGAPHPEQIARALDWGAAGIMVPMVSTAEKATACVRAMRYPPQGDRGLAGMVRAYDYGLHRDMPKPVFYAQIETIEGVQNARAIAALDDVALDVTAGAFAAEWAVPGYAGVLAEQVAAGAGGACACARRAWAGWRTGPAAAAAAAAAAARAAPAPPAAAL